MGQGGENIEMTFVVIDSASKKNGNAVGSLTFHFSNLPMCIAYVYTRCVQRQVIFEVSDVRCANTFNATARKRARTLG